MTFMLLVLIGYIIGSIPFSYLSMRLFTGNDIRKLGTGNATVTAVLMHGGKLPAAVALLAEISKAFLCLSVAQLMVGELWASLIILVAAVYGCSWSIWLKGGGGQGQTIMVSGLVLLSPVAMGIILGAFYFLPLVTTRRHFLSNQIYHLSIPVVLWLWNGSWEWALAGILFIVPFFTKQWLAGDDIIEAREARKAGENGRGVA